MKKWILVWLSSIFLTFSFSSGWAQSNADTAAAQSVIENWFAAMKAADLEKAGSYLAPQFTSIHTDGQIRNKAQELELIKNLHLKTYQLSNFHFVQSDNVMVVTYEDKTVENIDNKKIAPGAAGRMAVLQKQGDQWLILAYANLDPI